MALRVAFRELFSVPGFRKGWGKFGGGGGRDIVWNIGGFSLISQRRRSLNKCWRTQETGPCCGQRRKGHQKVTTRRSVGASYILIEN